jgi:hypothetical protein
MKLIYRKIEADKKKTAGTGKSVPGDNPGRKTEIALPDQSARRDANPPREQTTTKAEEQGDSGDSESPQNVPEVELTLEPEDGGEVDIFKSGVFKANVHRVADETVGVEFIADLHEDTRIECAKLDGRKYYFGTPEYRSRPQIPDEEGWRGSYIPIYRDGRTYQKFRRGRKFDVESKTWVNEDFEPGLRWREWYRNLPPLAQEDLRLRGQKLKKSKSETESDD